MVHPGRLVDPTSHRHRRLLLVEFALAFVTGESFAEQSAATLEHPDRLHPGEPQQRVLQFAEAFPPRIIQPFGCVRDGVDMAGRHITGSERGLEAGHLLTHLRTIRRRFRLPRRTSPIPRQHLSRRFGATLGGQLPGAAGDRHIDRIDPTPHPLRQRHRPAQTSPVTPGHIDRQQPGDRLADTTIIHHPTPLDPHDQPGGSRTPTTLNKGCDSDRRGRSGVRRGRSTTHSWRRVGTAPACRHPGTTIRASRRASWVPGRRASGASSRCAVPDM